MRHWWGMDGFFMEHGCMGPKHSSWNFPCFNGQYVSGLWLPGHWNPCQGCLPNWHVRCFRYLLAQALNWAVAGLESCHVSVMAIFRGLSFPSVKSDVKSSPKHDLFWCWFVQGLVLPTHQNLRQTTSKQTMHLRLVAEITLRDFTWYTFQFERPFFFGSGRRSRPPLT